MVLHPLPDPAEGCTLQRPPLSVMHLAGCSVLAPLRLLTRPDLLRRRPPRLGMQAAALAVCPGRFVFRHELVLGAGD